ncbi:hypothetical protein CPB84DRAFT_1869520 [Gymnopilus junonius]|uniref:tyrosinase n=1 Tax=Gymnopilus junonius TaxID=109634 RepID=A0A9P5NH95_GYMJU|nr:hypothetical protein CPB84DRAFT_1869520 [Gymnopilus junonius]
MSVAITTGSSGGTPNRLEINDFYEWNSTYSFVPPVVFIMQTKGTLDDPTSFFQIGSIHGFPYVSWNRVTGSKLMDPSSNAAGYCNHGNVLFPTWHKPYVALRQKVAATYVVDCAAWKKAADELRQPYWDWAANSVPPDEGRKITVNNPFYNYKFHAIDPSFLFAFHDRKATIRYPTKLKETLRAHQLVYTINTYNMLTRIQSWGAFSNDTIGAGGSYYNAIHAGIGGPNGHMSEVPTSTVLLAFDPVFFLHHYNVDHGTIIICPDILINQETRTTSSDVENTDKLGYTYPDFSGLDMTNRQAVYTAIGGLINRLYGTSISDRLLAANAPPSGAPALSTFGSAPPYHGSHDWTAHIEVKKYEVGQSFFQQTFCYNFAGAYFAFVNSEAKRCCYRRILHLNHAIAKHSGLDSLDPELHWRVQKTNGEPIYLAALQATIFSTPLSYPPSSIFPVTGEHRRCSHITHGHPGGCRLRLFF